MLKIILATALSLTFSMTQAATLKDVKGTITDVAIGEIDGGVIGDACLIMIEEDNGGLTALVTDFDDCADYDFGSAQVGKRVYIPASKISLIKNANVIGALKRFSPEPFYVDVVFSDIIAGLEK